MIFIEWTDTFDDFMRETATARLWARRVWSVAYFVYACVRVFAELAIALGRVARIGWDEYGREWAIAELGPCIDALAVAKVEATFWAIWAMEEIEKYRGVTLVTIRYPRISTLLDLALGLR